MSTNPIVVAGHLGFALLDRQSRELPLTRFPGADLEPYILLPGVTELLLALWLVVDGVNVQQSKDQASAAGECQ
jgi:hypothetical protein